MLKDCLEIFKSQYEQKGDSLVIHEYTLAEGSYVLVKKDGTKEILEISKKDIDKTHELYYYFAHRDYLSRLIDMNKPIDSNKIIHSNNYLSFFIKKESLIPNKDTGKIKLTEHIINNYYDILLDPRKKYDKDKTKIYNEVEKKYGVLDEEDIEFARSWIKNNIFNMLNEVKEGKNYLNVFFEENIDIYSNESNKYLVPNIYNSNKYNVDVDGILYGLPNNNMGLNSKKPYLEQKTRKNTIPYLISEEEVLLQDKFFDYLVNKANEGKTNIYLSENKIISNKNDEFPELDFNGYFLRIKKGKEVEIHDFDIITKMKHKIKGLNIQQIIPINPEKQILEYKEIKYIKDLSKIIDKVFFNKNLSINYFTDAKDIKINDSKVKQTILLTRNYLFSWFYKGKCEGAKSSFHKHSIDIIKNSILERKIYLAIEQFNLRKGILNYLKGGINMPDIISNLVELLRTKINSEKTQAIESDKEFYFATGQLVSYLISLNKSATKTHSLVNPILNCKDTKKLKDEVLKLFKKYNYRIDRGNKGNRRFDNLYTMVVGYDPEKNIDIEMLLAGYLFSNLIYETNK